MRIVFFGTPEFAVPSLERLVESRHEIVGIVTQPDRPRGRGLTRLPTPVKRGALEKNLDVIQPENLTSRDFLKALKEWRGDCFVVVGFRILPVEVFGLPSKGTVNLHASLLPKYRGAAPIQWAIINGETETGVTTFFIQEKVDTGDLILQSRCAIGPKETAGELHDRLAVIGAEILGRTVDLIDENRAQTHPQKGEPSRAPKIKPEDTILDWSLKADHIVNRIRAFSPRPGATTFLDGKRLKCFSGSVTEVVVPEKLPPGSVMGTGDAGLLIQTGTGVVAVREVQMEGKRKMTADAFLRGHGSLEGSRLASDGS